MVAEVSKINILVEKCCTCWNGNMKEALKKRMAAIAGAESDADSYQAYTEALGAIRFMEDAFFLDAHQADKLADLCADLHYC